MVYTTIACLWILTSDWVLGLLVHRADEMVGYSYAKGIFYVLGTGYMLYLLIDRHTKAMSRVLCTQERELESRGALIQELYHRIRNNLQAITGLIHLLPAVEAVKAIQAMDAVLTLVYTQESYDDLSLATMLENYRRECPGTVVIEGDLGGQCLALEEAISLMLALDQIFRAAWRVVPETAWVVGSLPMEGNECGLVLLARGLDADPRWLGLEAALAPQMLRSLGAALMSRVIPGNPGDTRVTLVWPRVLEARPGSGCSGPEEIPSRS